MKNGVLICSGTFKYKNIGDYIQSVSQEQFLDKVDCYVEREKLKDYESEDITRVIMNAWFMFNPKEFPPSRDILPLYISMHIVPSIADEMLSEETIEHLKKYEPIGARDTSTMDILESHGIRSYFSGCLTLTLGEKYMNPTKNDEIIFVDPYYELGANNSNKIHKILYSFFLCIKNIKKVFKLNKIFSCEFYSPISKISRPLDKLIHVASFYHTYSKAFSDDVLFNATYINHTVKQSDFKDDNEKMEYARSLIRKYATAKLIISSRIHCALPSIAVETPTIFITSDNLEKGRGRGGSNNRFGGLIQLMNTLKWSVKGVELTGNEEWLKNTTNRKITADSIIEITKRHYKIKADLIERVTDFLNSSINQ